MIKGGKRDNKKDDSLQNCEKRMHQIILVENPVFSNNNLVRTHKKIVENYYFVLFALFKYAVWNSNDPECPTIGH